MIRTLRWYHFALLLLALYLVSGAAYSQVVTCPDAAQKGKVFTACTPTGLATAPTTELVYWCESGGLLTPNAAMDLCGAGQWLPNAQMQTPSWTWTVQGWQRHGSMTFPPATPPPPPPPGADARMTITPTRIIRGGSATIMWTAVNVSSCTASWGAVGLTGTLVVSPTVTTPYSLMCNGDGSASGGTTVLTVIDPPVVVITPPKCKPFPLGTGTRPYISQTAQAFAVTWFCGDKFSYSSAGFGGEWTQLKPDWGALAANALQSESAFDDLWRANVTGHLDSTTAPGALYISLMTTNRPLDPVWLTAKNGTSVTRPTYPVVNAVRSLTSNGRVNVGLPCDCKALGMDGPTVYCGVAGKDNASTTAVDVLPLGTVTACTKAP